MGWILEKETKKGGLEGEPGRARLSIKLAAISWALYFLLWESGVKLLTLFAIFALLSAWVWSARGFFHLVTVGIVRLPSNMQGGFQVAVAVMSAAVPVLFFLPDETGFIGQILVQAFEPFTETLLFWLPMGLFVYLVYVLRASAAPLLEVQRYLVLVAVVFLIASLGGYGVFANDEDGDSLDIERLDSKSIEGRMSMAASYIRLVTLGYGTLVCLHLRERNLKRRLEQARSRMDGTGLSS